MVSILPLAFPEAENVSKHLNARSVAAPHKCLLTPITEPLKRKKTPKVTKGCSQYERLFLKIASQIFYFEANFEAFHTKILKKWVELMIFIILRQKITL